MKKISIIIPVYDVEKHFLEKCLSSIYNQKYKYFEVIVIDDGSSIDYSDVINKYCNINYYKTSNHGVSHARNIGLNKTSGDYIMFLDSDDYLSPDSLYFFSKIINCNNYQIILSRNYIIDTKIKKNKYEYNVSRKIDDKEKLFRSIIMNEDKYFSCIDTVWAKMYQKDFLTANKILFNEKIRGLEDILFNYECYYKSSSIYYLNEVTYNYMVNSFSICHSFQNDLLEVSLTYLREFKDFLIRNSITDSNFSMHVFITVVRLFRKYFTHIINTPRFFLDLELLLKDTFIREQLLLIDPNSLDIYKKELLDLLINKNKVEIEKFVQNICIQGLLKK